MTTPSPEAIVAAQAAISSWQTAALAAVDSIGALKAALDTLTAAGIAVNATAGPSNVIAFHDPDGRGFIAPLLGTLFPTSGRATTAAMIVAAKAMIASAVAHPANLRAPNEPK